MPWMLGRLTRQGEEGWEIKTPEGSERLPRSLLPRGQDGEAVLIRQAAQGWGRVQRPLHISPWPSALRGVAIERAEAAPEQQATLQPAVAGTWLIDPSGRPCERGLLRLGGDFVPTLSYAGWRLVDLAGQEVTLRLLEGPEGRVAVLEPGRAQAPRYRPPPDRLHVTWSPLPPQSRGAARPEPRPALPPVRQEPLEPAIPAPPPPAPPLRLDKRFAFSELRYLDGALEFEHQGRWRNATADWSRAALEDIKDLLQARLGRRKVPVHGISPDFVADKPTGFDELLHQVERSRFLDELIGRGALIEVTEVVERMPGGLEGPEDILEIEELGFGPRKEAFRLLFRLSVERQPARILPGTGWLFVIDHPGGGRPWWVWEDRNEDAATYVFRPTATEDERRLETHVAREDWSRKLLLQDKELQAELGFERRVFHRERWEEWIKHALGLGPKPD